ncbi:hypothetical protein MG293_020813 [Ovis ammon polii]|uniref:Uncharacterized protein n=1 Tax=Ovis ammon polii TaxID=230172 RepID=A0AAD4TMD9_OVIAM|nr:hypothetical protein MG293_020813 [Ovis ammon polii]
MCMEAAPGPQLQEFEHQAKHATAQAQQMEGPPLEAQRKLPGGVPSVEAEGLHGEHLQRARQLQREQKHAPLSSIWDSIYHTASHYRERANNTQRKTSNGVDTVDSSTPAPAVDMDCQNATFASYSSDKCIHVCRLGCNHPSNRSRDTPLRDDSCYLWRFLKRQAQQVRSQSPRVGAQNLLAPQTVFTQKPGDRRPRRYFLLSKSLRSNTAVTLAQVWDEDVSWYMTVL